MSEWLLEIGHFVVQVSFIVLLVAIVAILLVRLKGESSRTRLRLEEMNERMEQRRRRLAMAATEPGARKSLLKTFRRQDKRNQSRQRKQDTQPQESRGTTWVIDFHGDIKATGVSRLAEEISCIIAAAAAGDEVVIRLESAGGLVHSYGLAAAQLERLREAGLSVTICVDKVAASGGYLMACAADHLRAAPFAVLGSIGVVAQLPNVHRLLKRHDIDVELHTAGEFKRTLTVMGENTPEGREKFQADLEHIHTLFKQHVAERRPHLDIDSIATGEVWYGQDALAKGLVDALGTSEAYLMQKVAESRVISVRLETRHPVADKVGLAVSRGLEGALDRALERLQANGWQKR